MSHGLMRARVVAREREVAQRTPGSPLPRGGTAVAERADIGEILALQRDAGNRAVTAMLQRAAVSAAFAGPARGRAPTAPAPAGWLQREEDEDPEEAARAAEEATDNENATDEDAELAGHSPEEIEEKKAEGEGVTMTDEVIDAEGTAPPAAPAGVSAGVSVGSGAGSSAGSGAGAGPGAGAPHGGFHDGGRVGTVPFGCLLLGPMGRSGDRRPRAMMAGGRTGSVPWIGGGAKGGPKGNQPAGEIKPLVEPAYDSRSNWLADADVWVREGTGIADVKRDYISSAAGDQGNGWWISPASAAALETHEQRHVNASKDQYASYIQPVLDRIAKSETTGKGKTWLASKGIALLSQQIGWANGIRKFIENDNAWNAPNAQIDTEDFGALGYPHNFDAKKPIQGKEYQHFSILNSEPDPY